MTMRDNSFTWTVNWCGQTYPKNYSVSQLSDYSCSNAVMFGVERVCCLS